MLEAIFHAEGGADDADSDDDDGWLDLDPEDPAKKENVLMQKIAEARENGISKVEVTALEGFLCDFLDMITLKLDKGEPAYIEMLLGRLKPNANPVQANQLRYPEEMRTFMSNLNHPAIKAWICDKSDISRMGGSPTHYTQATAGDVPPHSTIPPRKQPHSAYLLANAQNRCGAVRCAGM